MPWGSFRGHRVLLLGGQARDHHVLRIAGGLDDLELATLEWVDGFNNRRRLHHRNTGRVPQAKARAIVEGAPWRRV